MIFFIPMYLIIKLFYNLFYYVSSKAFYTPICRADNSVKVGSNRRSGKWLSSFLSFYCVKDRYHYTQLEALFKAIRAALRLTSAVSQTKVRHQFCSLSIVFKTRLGQRYKNKISFSRSKSWDNYKWEQLSSAVSWAKKAFFHFVQSLGYVWRKDLKSHLHF